MESPRFAPVLRTQADVETAWRQLIDPLGWSSRRLCFLLVGADDRPLPVITEVDELPDRLTVDLAAGAVASWRFTLDELAPEGRVAILLCRPGVGGPQPDDRASAGALYAAARIARVPLEVIHLATDVEFFPLPQDAVDLATA